MKTPKYFLQNRKGVSLVVVLLFMVILMGGGLSLLDQVTYDLKRGGEHLTKDNAYLIAEGGFNKAIWWLDTVYKQPDPSATPLDVTLAPVRYRPALGHLSPLSLPGNHPDSYPDCETGAARSGVLSSFKENLVAQPLGGGTFSVAAKMITTRTDCANGGTQNLDEMWEIQSTGTFQGVSRTVVGYLRRKYSATNFGAFGVEKVEMDSNVETLSFDSSQGTFDPTPPPGTWSNSCACDAGVGTNGTGESVIELGSNITINGDASPGPNADPNAVSISGNSVVAGSTDPLLEPAIFPPLPVAPDCVAPACSDFSLNGNNEAILSPGNYNGIVLNSNSVLVLEPGTYYVTDFKMNSNTQLVVKGKVTIVVRDEFEMDSNAKANFGGSPLNLEVIGTGTDSAGDLDPEIEIDSNSGFFGTIMAPNAEVEIGSNARIYGSVVGKVVDIDSNARLFRDKAVPNSRIRKAGDVASLFFYGNPNSDMRASLAE